MMRMMLFMALVSAVVTANAAEPGGVDTEAAAYARTVQLKTKVSIATQDMLLIDFLKEIAAETEKQLVKTPKWTYASDVAKDAKITYRCKDKPIEDVLADVFKSPGYGYVVLSKDADRLDGFIRITKGTERGFDKGAEPSAADRQAMAKLETARDLIKAGKKTTAKAVLTLLSKDANMAVAKEAAKLLESLDK